MLLTIVSSISGVVKSSNISHRDEHAAAFTDSSTAIIDSSSSVSLLTQLNFH
jgi:hypothetical protein